MDHISQKDTTKNMKTFTHKKYAFTMIELVFVIIVLGILASLALPRMDRDLKQQAADHMLSSIRYTQHLALMDYKHKFDDPKWQQRFWRIVFNTCNVSTNKFYMIGSDDDMESSSNALFDRNESAIDPTNGQLLFWTGGADCSSGGDGTVSENIFLSKKYGITAITPLTGSGCAGAAHIAFDHLGRPYHGVNFSQSGNTVTTHPIYSGYMQTACTFTFTMSDGDEFNITIEPETGFASIGGQPNS